MPSPEAIVACPVCAQAQRLDSARAGQVYECIRCGAFLGGAPERESLHVTAALTLAALVLYVPANVYPILRMYWSGAYSESTVWEGVTSLARSNQWFVAAIVFLAIPRVGFGFFLKGKNGLTLSGFSDGVKLGGHGVIKNDSTIVMRVEIDSKYGGRDKPEIHWRGVAFDNYDQGRWTRTRLAPPTTTFKYVPRNGVERHTLDWEASGPAVAAIENGVKQEIWLDPLELEKQRASGVENPRALGGRDHAPARAPEELHREALFELAQAVAHRRLSYVKIRGRAGDGSGPRHGIDETKMADFEHHSLMILSSCFPEE